MPHPLEGYWLSRAVTVAEHSKPFSSIMELPAPEKAKELNLVDTGRKFGDSFEGYIQKRKEVETWLALSCPTRKVAHPIYFRLTTEPINQNGWINIRASEIPQEFLTLTLRDSFDCFLGKPEGKIESARYKVFNPKTFSTFKKDNNPFPYQDYTGHKPTPYIEVQLWKTDLDILKRITEQFKLTQTKTITQPPQPSISHKAASLTKGTGADTKGI